MIDLADKIALACIGAALAWGLVRLVVFLYGVGAHGGFGG